jgi:hypothetical protein
MSIKIKKRFLPLILILIVINAVMISLFTIVSMKKYILPQKGAPLEKYAEKVLALCKGSSYRPSCYDKEVPKLMDVMSMEDAFAVTSIVQDQDRTYAYCHVLGHELSAREVKKNPTDWKSVIARCPSGVCSNGCLHGGLQERFRSEYLTDEQTEKIIPELEHICEAKPNWSPTGLEQNSCYHALGHLTMYITNADINKSVAICDRIAKKPDGRDLAFLCYDGAFMQLNQPLEPEDFALIKGKEITKKNVAAFCNSFSGEKNASCWTESWPIFASEIKTPQGIVDLCSKIKEDARGRCYGSMFYGVPIQLEFDNKKVAQYCNGITDENLKATCFGSVTDRYIETDYRNIKDAVALCQAANSVTAKDSCYEDTVNQASFNFHPGSKQYTDLCNSLPSTWKNKCLGFPTS